MRGFRETVTVSDAIEQVLNAVSPLGVEQVGFRSALGRVLDEDVVSGVDVPAFNRSAMDGYAVRGKNTFGAKETSPVTLNLLGEQLIGRKVDVEVGENEAVKVMTGTQIPEGADAVVMVEYTREMGGTLEVVHPVPPGKNVSQRGEDLREGEVILKKGRVIRPSDIAVLASLGRTDVSLIRRPSVGVVSTGDELVDPEEPLDEGGLPEGKIFETNSFTLEAMLSDAGALTCRSKAVEDDLSKLTARVSDLVSGNDMVLLSGGSSIGDRDYMPEVVSSLGEMVFHGVSMRPGEPAGFGTIGGKPVFLLPGYPVACMVAFITFVMPCLQKMGGREVKNPFPTVRAKVGKKTPSQVGRRDFIRVRVIEEDGQLLAEPLRRGGSGVISSMVRSDGFILVPEGTEGYFKGDEVSVHLF